MNDIRYSVAGRVATLSFNRPDKKNAITAAMYAAIRKVASVTDTSGMIFMKG